MTLEMSGFELLEYAVVWRVIGGRHRSGPLLFVDILKSLQVPSLTP